MAAQLAAIPDNVKIDIDQYLKTISLHHKVPRTYKVHKEALNKFIEIKDALKDIDKQSNHG